MEIRRLSVATDLNAKCTVPWSGPNSGPRCCTSDLTLAEFTSLRGKMDASVPSATTPEGYLGATPSWRTDLYTGHTPELKAGNPARIAEVFAARPSTRRS
jgi:glycerophosphoryl diester phosphodiesterase